MKIVWWFELLCLLKMDPEFPFLQ